MALGDIEQGQATELLYFAYGSNMSSLRLQRRTPSARFVSIATLHRHHLRFHKVGKDGSAKCDAYETGDQAHDVIGVLYTLSGGEQPALDRAEGRGHGYEVKTVQVKTACGDWHEAMTYYATRIDPSLAPYHWYLEHVLRGANEHQLPSDYIATIKNTISIDDPDHKRATIEIRHYPDHTPR